MPYRASFPPIRWCFAQGRYPGGPLPGRWRRQGLRITLSGAPNRRQGLTPGAPLTGAHSLPHGFSSVLRKCPSHRPPDRKAGTFSACARLAHPGRGHRPCHSATLNPRQPRAKAPGQRLPRPRRALASVGAGCTGRGSSVTRRGGGTRVAFPDPAQRGNPFLRIGRIFPAGRRSDCCFSSLSGRNRGARHQLRPRFPGTGGSAPEPSRNFWPMQFLLVAGSAWGRRRTDGPERDHLRRPQTGAASRTLPEERGYGNPPPSGLFPRARPALRTAQPAGFRMTRTRRRAGRV